MRIIAGSAKGKTLLSPKDTRVRPTSDRAREGLFSSLESSFGSLRELTFLDLFAGSGAVGVEALSRGAALVHSVEADGDVGNLAISNLQLVKNPEGKYRLFHSSVLSFLESDHPVLPAGRKYDIIFMDPPYNVSNEEIEVLLEIIIGRQLLEPRGLIAIERETKGKPFTWPEPLTLEKIRSYGQGSIFYGGYSASVLP
jgi:16S rRNA (guanine966-N2)-methyltransferase